jgi:SAM-dependent methyltransferase
VSELFAIREFFDKDYLYFTVPGFTPEFNDDDVQIICKLLDLQPGMEVLDLCCGYGRIATRLAQLGCKVTGFDVTDLFLDIARKESSELRLDITYVQGDMRKLPWTNRFDRVVTWFNSFGYFTDDENVQILAEIHRALRPDGRLLLDLMNRDGMMRVLPYDFVQEQDNNFLIYRHKYNPLTGVLEAERIVVRDGHVSRLPYAVRLFTFPEIRFFLQKAGFSRIEGFGCEGEPFSLHSRQMETIGYW